MLAKEFSFVVFYLLDCFISKVKFIKINAYAIECYFPWKKGLV